MRASDERRKSPKRTGFCIAAPSPINADKSTPLSGALIPASPIGLGPKTTRKCRAVMSLRLTVVGTGWTGRSMIFVQLLPSLLDSRCGFVIAPKNIAAAPGRKNDTVRTVCGEP